MSCKLKIIIILSGVLLCSCTHRRYIQINGYAQGGTYCIKCDAAREDAVLLKNGIDSILNVIEIAASGYNPSSLISRYNRGEIDADDSSATYRTFMELTEFGDSIAVVTGGAVDTRAAAIFDAWGFGFTNGKMPTFIEAAAAAADRSKLNFNAIAQGYSCDCIARYLNGKGINNMLVEVGGEMFCQGVNPRGEGWSIGIDTPEDNAVPGRKLSGSFTLEQDSACGVVTSGNYRKFYVVDGVKYSHTVDPRSGLPVRHNLLSATIIAPTSALADAFATYCMVIGMDEAIKFIESRDDLEGCLISSDRMWFSKGIDLKQE